MQTESGGSHACDKCTRVRRREARADWTGGKVTLAMLSILIIIGLSTEWTYSDEPGLKPGPSQETSWVDGIGSGFRKGLY